MGRIKSRHSPIDYQKFNDTFNAAVLDRTKENSDDFIEQVYIMVTRYVQEYKHAKLTEDSKEDMIQYLTLSCWETLKRGTYKPGGVTPYWYFFGNLKFASGHFIFKEPDTRNLLELPDISDSGTDEEEQDFIFGNTEFLDIYSKYAVAEEKPENYLKNTYPVLKKCFIEVVKKIRFKEKRKVFISYVLWYLVMNERLDNKFLKKKAHKLLIPFSDEKFLIQYSRVLYRRFLLELKVNKELRRKVILNEV